jgi:hypothetical protein
MQPNTITRQALPTNRDRVKDSTPIYSAIAAKLAQIGMRLAAEGKLKQTSP